MVLLFWAAVIPTTAQETFTPQTGQTTRLRQAIQEPWRWVFFGERDGLPSTDVSQIVESSDGTIWANTSAGVGWYDGYQWHTAPCPIIPHFKSQTSIQPFDAGSVIGISDGQVTIFRPDSCRRVEFQYEGRPVRIVSTSRREKDEIIVLDSDQNYYRWDGKSGVLSTRLVSGQDNYNSRLSIQNGAPIFYASPRGLMRLDSDASRLMLDRSTLRDQEHLTGLYIRSATDNTLGSGIISIAFPQDWIGVWEWSNSSGLTMVREMAGRVARLLAISRRGEAVAAFSAAEAWIKSDGAWQPLNPIPGPLRAANSLFFDHIGRLWVATSQGIHVLRSNEQDWSRVQFPFPDLRNHVNALMTARDGRLWVGTAEGIYRVSANGQIEFIDQIRGQRIGLLTSIVQTHDGAVWCSSGASFRGVYRYLDGNWTYFGPGEGLADTPYHKLVADRQGRLWALATGRGRRDGLSGVYLLGNNRFERWAPAADLPDSRVYTAASHDDGTLWFGSVSALSRFQNGKWRHWTLENAKLVAAPFQIHPRASGGIYFVDRTNGLGEITPAGTLIYHRISETKAGQSGWDILEDNTTNTLWVSTRGGVMLRRNGAWSTIGPAAGLENPETWPIIYWRGNFCMGTDGSGMQCLSKNFLHRPSPRININPPRVDASTVFLSWRVIAHSESSSMEGNRARYRIDSGPWSSWLSVASLVLPDVAQGSHSLEMQAMDHFGAQSTISPPIYFRVQAPLFQQPIFWIPVTLSLLAAAVAIYAFVRRTYKHNRELAEKEESFRALIEYSSVGITLRDRNQKVFYVSPAVSIILGYDPSELLGDFRNDIMHPDDVTESRSRMATLIESPGQTQRARCRMRHKNGEYRWIEVISRNLLDNPSVGAIVTNLRDITDSTNAELAAAEARQRAENANQAKSDFLAMISHEIRTPMNGITGMCQLLLESNLNREQQDYAETIAQSAQSLLALINDVLDFSRIEAGKLTIERAPIDLASLLNEVAQLMRVRAGEKGLRLNVVYPPDAPRAFYGDALRIRQILFNLTGNAVKFTHQGSVDLTAAIEYDSGSRYRIVISVVDTGIGISEDKLPLVFQKFTQADLSTTRRYGGSGLGLSISQSLAELMGGKIAASSRLGEGSEFRLELQLDAAPENSITRRDATVDPLQPLPEPLDILLVEDNKVNQKLALRLLERLGCTVRVAESGIEALELIDSFSFDLILMDCQMPEMDGYEATRRIREREHSHRHIPIVAITANAMESDLERCLSAGMDSYLTKPIDFLKLRDALETWGIDYRAPRATSDPGAA